MKEVHIFHFAGEDEYPYGTVEEEATEWLQKHPKAVLLASHTNQSSRPSRNSEDHIIDFALTLIVEVPSPEA